MKFLILAASTVAALHYYLWRRLVHDTQLPTRLRWLATLGLLSLAASIPIAWRLRWFWPPYAHARTSSLVAYDWFGLAAYAAALLCGWDVARWLLARTSKRRVRPGPPHDAAAATAETASDPRSAVSTETEPRRVFLARAAAGSALAAAAGIGAFGTRAALWDITMPEVPIGLRRLPSALDGYTIALLTDVHIGPVLDGRFLRHLAEQVNCARPDAIAIAGDLVDGSVHEIGSQVAELTRLRARDGVFFVTGNHEYYSGARAWIAYLRKLGLRVLMNERVSLGDRRARGATFDLAGIPDRYASRWGDTAANARHATSGRDPDRELVMLAHQPVEIEQTAAVEAGLQLSGHTHGGQLYPFGAIALLSQPYLAGLHVYEPTQTQVYVSRGTGFWGPPMRVLAPAEIALVRLHSV